MLGRYSSAIRAACANERSCGSVRGAISDDRPYRDLSYLPNNRVCARDPLERAWALVVFADVCLDRLHEVAHGAKGSAADAFARDLREPALDLVQPRGAGRGKVNVIAGVCAEPLLHFRMLVRAVVVQDERSEEHTSELQSLRHLV